MGKFLSQALPEVMAAQDAVVAAVYKDGALSLKVKIPRVEKKGLLSPEFEANGWLDFKAGRWIYSLFQPWLWSG